MVACQVPIDPPSNVTASREQKADAEDLQGAALAGFLEAGWGRVTGASPLLGSDKEAILELITSRSNRQRQEICQNYKSLYGKVTMATRGRVGWGGE